MVPDATIVVSAAGEILDANELAERLFGYAKNELHGQMVEALIPACARRRHQRHRAGFNSSPSKRSMGRGVELSGVRKDGSEFSADCSLIPVQIQNETLMVVAIRDLTEREQAEEALRESESRLRETMDGMLEGCQIIGFDWRYLYVNDVVARHGRRAKEDLLGHTMMEIYPGIEETEMFGYLRRCMEQRLPHRMENEFTYPDGAAARCELSVQPAPEGIFILSLDNTEQKQAEEALQHAREELEGKVERRLEQGESYGLTFREMTVLSLVADGQADKEIALTLAISPYTVSKHVASILLKMKAHSRTEAGVRAVREGLVG